MSAQATTGKTRSPNYPAINLEEAIQRLKTIYDKQQRYPATREVLAQLMGYKGLNGASATVISALSKYGILEGYGDTLRISELGQDLVLHRTGDPEYSVALRSAAFMPVFFQELRDQYPSGLPHDHSLRATLIKRGFNAKSIDNAVRAYRDTMEFLNAESGAIFEDASRNQPADEVMPPQAQGVRSAIGQNAPSPGQRVVALPLSPTEWATLHATFPLSEALWNQMLTVLNAMKPALVVVTEQPASLTAPWIKGDGSESEDE